MNSSKNKRNRSHKKRKIIYSEIKSNYHSNLDMWIEKAIQDGYSKLQNAMWDRVKSKLALKAAIRIGVPDGMFIALEFFQGKFPFDTMLKTAIGAGDADVKSPGLETRECAGGSTGGYTINSYTNRG